MAIDESTRKKNALELYQIDEDSIIPFFGSHIAELSKFVQEHDGQNLSLLELLKQFIRTCRLPFNMQRYMSVQSTFIRRLSRNAYKISKTPSATGFANMPASIATA